MRTSRKSRTPESGVERYFEEVSRRTPPVGYILTLHDMTTNTSGANCTSVVVSLLLLPSTFIRDYRTC